MDTRVDNTSASIPWIHQIEDQMSDEHDIDYDPNSGSVTLEEDQMSNEHDIDYWKMIRCRMSMTQTMIHTLDLSH